MFHLEQVWNNRNKEHMVEYNKTCGRRRNIQNRLSQSRIRNPKISNSVEMRPAKPRASTLDQLSVEVLPKVSRHSVTGRMFSAVLEDCG